MSGAGENRWRRSGPNRPNQDRSSGANTPTRESGQQQQGLGSVSGNAWGRKGKGAAPADRPGPAPASPSQAEHHVPVRDFNASEVREFLKKRYLESVGDNPAAYHHKVEGDSVPKRSSGAWGSRGNMSHLMPNGQDFFTQLKKQLQNLEQTK